MPVIAVVGGQWGDEGKGKVIDLLAGRAQVVVRAHGGDNAGHTVVNALGKFALHLVPAGIFNPDTVCVIGAGVALNPLMLIEEIDALSGRGVDARNLVISERTHLVMPYHLTLDQVEEQARGAGKIGTTGRGIGPTYTDKVSRIGLRAGDLLDENLFEQRLETAVRRKNRLLDRLFDAVPIDCAALLTTLQPVANRLRPLIREPGPLLAQAIAADQTVLIEGAHGTLLDLDYGSYPYVTSSSPTVAGLLLGAGIGPRHLSLSVGVFKAYQSRVGSGPMPTELLDETGELIRQTGEEFGTTTGRPRRCGWFDAVAARHAVRINGFDCLALTRLDILDNLPRLRICVAYDLDGQRLEELPARTDLLARCRPIYEDLPGWQAPSTAAETWDDLPTNARKYAARIQELLGVELGLVGIGQSRDQSITLGPLTSLLA